MLRGFIFLGAFCENTHLKLKVLSLKWCCDMKLNGNIICDFASVYEMLASMFSDVIPRFVI